MKNVMIYQVKTNRTLDAIEQGIQEAAVRHGFGVVAIHDLKQTMSKKNVDLGRECRIYEVCHAAQAKRVLDAEPAISTMLPCRISVMGSAGDYTVATMLPTAMIGAFNRPDLATVAREVEADITAIINESTQAA